MKFHWFAQQYYTKLPQDYGDVNRSSWVTAPIDVADPVQVGEDYHMYIRLMQQADGLGWDSLLLNEHHQTSLAMTPSPNLIASILAAGVLRQAGAEVLAEVGGLAQAQRDDGEGSDDEVHAHCRLDVEHERDKSARGMPDDHDGSADRTDDCEHVLDPIAERVPSSGSPNARAASSRASASPYRSRRPHRWTGS